MCCCNIWLVLTDYFLHFLPEFAKACVFVVHKKPHRCSRLPAQQLRFCPVLLRPPPPPPPVIQGFEPSYTIDLAELQGRVAGETAAATESALRARRAGVEVEEHPLQGRKAPFHESHG